jgi:hypothetical protein
MVLFCLSAKDKCENNTEDIVVVVRYENAHEVGKDEGECVE